MKRAELRRLTAEEWARPLCFGCPFLLRRYDAASESGVYGCRKTGNVIGKWGRWTEERLPRRRPDCPQAETG